MTGFQQEKAVVRAFHAELSASAPDGAAEVLARYVTPDLHWRGVHPFNEQRGAEAIAAAFWAMLRSSFPQARFRVEHTIGRVDDFMPPRAAIRWTLEGRHEGWGAFGRPTGAEVYVMGISHAEFGPRGIRREYALFDEVAVWKQILLQTAELREVPDREGRVPPGVVKLGPTG